MTTLVSTGQATPPVEILRGESADLAVSTSAGFEGVAWLQKRLDDYTWSNVHAVQPGDAETINGECVVRVWVERMELGDDLTATITANDDVLWEQRRSNGKPVVQVRAISGLVGVGAGGSGAVSTVNGKIPESGDVSLSAADVGADPVGAANNAKLEAIEEAQARITLHAQQVNPHGLDKAALGLGLVENIEPSEMPVSSAQAAAIAAAVANRLTDAPSNGTEFVRKNGAWVPATGGGSGTQMQIVTESEWAAIDPGTPGVVYHVYPDPPPQNLVSSSFASGWVDNATWDPSGDNAVLVGNTNGDIVHPVSGRPSSRRYSFTFSVINHIKGNLTAAYVAGGTTTLVPPTRQGTASPGTSTTYTVEFNVASAPTAFLIRANAQDSLRNATISNPIVYDIGPAV